MYWVIPLVIAGIVVIVLFSLPTKDTRIPPQPPAPEEKAQTEEAALPVEGTVSSPEALYEETMSNFEIASSAFANDASIPAEYTADGRDVNPPLTIEGVPDRTVSLVLIMDDPDAPVGTWDHWILWNIPASTKEIPADSVPAGAVQGANGWGRSEYGGPSPPSGTHHYVFKLYALDAFLDLKPGARKQAVERAMDGHIIAQARLVGRYSRSR